MGSDEDFPAKYLDEASETFRDREAIDTISNIRTEGGAQEDDGTIGVQTSTSKPAPMRRCADARAGIEISRNSPAALRKGCLRSVYSIIASTSYSSSNLLLRT